MSGSLHGDCAVTLVLTRPVIIHLVHSTLLSPFYNYLKFIEHQLSWNTESSRCGLLRGGVWKHGDEIYKSLPMWKCDLTSFIRDYGVYTF